MKKQKHEIISVTEIVFHLHTIVKPEDREGMQRFGIPIEKAIGIRMPVLRMYAHTLGKDHAFAAALWEAGLRETRILASLVDLPECVTEKQMDAWALDFDGWELCDQVCGNLFEKTPYVYKKAFEWSSREEEFVKRAAFAMTAWHAVHAKKVSDEFFFAFFPVIKREANDERQLVKKGVNWALRQIGKRNEALRIEAVAVCRELLAMPSKAAQWIAKDAVKELTDEHHIELIAQKNRRQRRGDA